VADRVCVPPDSDPPAVPRLPVSEADRARLAALGYSAVALRAAEAIGAMPLLWQLHQAPSEGAWLLARQELSERVTQGVLDAVGTVAQIDCEGERGDRLRARLQAVEERRSRYYGVAGLLLGAGTAAMSGGLALAGLNSAGNIAGIVGGGAQASAAGMPLFGAAPEARMATPKNLLAEVWQGPAESRLFPISVWQYLGARREAGGSSLAQLRAEWQTPEILGPPDSAESEARAAILFADSGLYTPALLEARDRMLDLLEASVALMNRDLRTLLREVRGRVALGRRGVATAPPRVRR